MVGMEFGGRRGEGSVQPLSSLLQQLSGGVVGGAGAGLLACLLGGFWGWMGLLLVCDCGTEKAVSILGLYSNALTSAWLGGRPPPTVPPISAGY